MQDRFKFRFFETYDNTMLDCKDYDFEEILESGKPVMQCTGLKDKNGKLIYEGDVVNGSCGVYWGKMIVEYNVAGFVLNKNGKYLNFLEGENYIEVIGNIYENPELLTHPTESEGVNE